MLKKDLLKLIEKATDDQDIDDLVKDSDLAKSLQASGLTLDAFKGKLKEKEFKAFIDSENDKYHDKALKTWKENNLEKELDSFIKEKYPDLVKDPKDKEMLEMKKKIEQMEKESARKDLLTEAIKYANEKKLPTAFVDKFLGEDLDSTKANLDSFGEDWSKGLEVMVNEKLKSSSYVPGGTGSDGKPISVGAKIAAQNNNLSSVPSDPWASK
jgi:hypothetical protein